jgi:hypothetical protein
MQKLAAIIGFISDFTDETEWENFQKYAVNMFTSAIDWAMTFSIPD